jgi:hypothetical protein
MTGLQVKLKPINLTFFSIFVVKKQSMYQNGIYEINHIRSRFQPTDAVREGDILDQNKEYFLAVHAGAKTKKKADAAAPASSCGTGIFGSHPNRDMEGEGRRAPAVAARSGPRVVETSPFEKDQKRRSTACSDWPASCKACTPSCWRVWSASRFAPSSLMSATVRRSAPVSRILTVSLVYS